MPIIKRNLIIEQPNYDLSFVMEQKNPSEDARLHIEGVYMQYGKLNKNRRKYLEEEMIAENDRYIQESVRTGSAVGELNHSQSPEIDLERVCHRIVSLTQDGNDYIGKSMVTTSTPKGKVLEGLINDGVRIGMSTKALGSIDEDVDKDGGSFVRNFMLIGVDAVHEPSCGDAFVNGILENKQFIISSGGKAAEAAFEVFEEKLSKYPSQYRSEINEHIHNAVMEMLSKF